MISFEEFSKRQEEAERKFGAYAKAVIEWAFYCPDLPPPDPRDYFDEPLSVEK